MSCDPDQSLKIENKTKAKASIKFIFRKGKRPNRFEEFAKQDTLLVSLDTMPNKTIKDFSFGLGTWYVQDRLDSLISIVDYIEVETWKSKEIYSNKIQIKEFFKSRLNGRLHKQIEIKLE